MEDMGDEGIHRSKEFLRACLARGTPETADRQRQPKRSVAPGVVEAKTWVWEEFSEVTEQDFWSTLKQKRCSAHSV